MAVEVHTYLLDVMCSQYARVCRESYVGYRVKAMCLEIHQLVLTSSLVYSMFNLPLWRRRYLYTAASLTP